jgi:transcriptional regulator of met regulon
MVVRLALLALLAAPAPAQQKPANLFQEVDEMTSALSEITGWPVKRKVPAKIITKDEFRRQVESRMKGSSTNKELHAEELTLKMFGFIPQDFNLAKETVELVSEQAAAFYDYSKKRLFVLDSTSEGTEQRVALVHELAHALADQQHPLGKYLHKGSPDDDASTAREAVMEGQATWLTWAYVSRRNGGKAEVSQEMIEKLTDNSGAGGADFPVFSKEPLYLRESLVFPYDEGMKFQDAVYKKLGRQSFDALFNRPPRSTQQILHPATYIEDEKPTDPDPPALDKPIAKQFHVLNEGSVGEFDHSMLLRQFVGEKEGRAAARAWRGGAFRLYENRNEKYCVLSYASEWTSPDAARHFFTLYQRVMKGKWKQMKVSEKSADHVYGTGDSGKFQLRVSGTTVTFMEGLR